MDRNRGADYGAAMKALLWTELLTLFGLPPLLYAAGLIPLPKIPLLLGLFLGCLVYLMCKQYPARRLCSGLTAIEHAVYGCIVFTTGLGRFFSTPS